MSQTEGQLDSGRGITYLVFDADHQERRSWRFCNSRLPRSELVYFTQIIKIIFLIAVSLAKYRSSKFKVMNKIISATNRLFMAVCGPSCCGKTELIFKKLLVSTFFPEFQIIYYFYQHDHPKIQSLEKKQNIHFKKFSNFELISELENCRLVFDYSYEEIFNDKEFSK